MSGTGLPLPPDKAPAHEVAYTERSEVLRHMVGDRGFYEAARPQVDEMQYFAQYPHFQVVYDILGIYCDEDLNYPNMASFTQELHPLMQERNVHDSYYHELMKLTILIFFRSEPLLVLFLHCIKPHYAYLQSCRQVKLWGYLNRKLKQIV